MDILGAEVDPAGTIVMGANVYGGLSDGNNNGNAIDIPQPDRNSVYLFLY